MSWNWHNTRNINKRDNWKWFVCYVCKRMFAYYTLFDLQNAKIYVTPIKFHKPRAFKLILHKFTEVYKNLNRYKSENIYNMLKIILMNYQNNYVKISMMSSNAVKSFDILTTTLHNFLNKIIFRSVSS